MADRYQGDYGETIAITTTGMALETADTVVLRVRYPGADVGTYVEWSPVVIDEQTVSYVLETEDILEPGLYVGTVYAVYLDQIRSSSPFYLTVGRTP